MHLVKIVSFVLSITLWLGIAANFDLANEPQQDMAEWPKGTSLSSLFSNDTNLVIELCWVTDLALARMKYR